MVYGVPGTGLPPGRIIPGLEFPVDRQADDIAGVDQLDRRDAAGRRRRGEEQQCDTGEPPAGDLPSGADP